MKTTIVALAIAGATLVAAACSHMNDNGANTSAATTGSSANTSSATGTGSASTGATTNPSSSSSSTTTNSTGPR